MVSHTVKHKNIACYGQNVYKQISCKRSFAIETRTANLHAKNDVNILALLNCNKNLRKNLV